MIIIKKMHMKKSLITIWFIILLSFISSIYFYPKMPEKIASHWKTNGKVDGYISKSWGLFLIPFLLVGLGLFFTFITKIELLEANIKKFKKYYDGFIILFFAFMFSIHMQIIFWNTGIKISPNTTIPIGLGILFFYCGIFCENIKKNWFIGIRTPWTLKSERVWEITHKIGGKAFKVAGVIAFIGVFFQKYALFFVLVPVISVVLYTIIYSYIQYQREIK